MAAEVSAAQNISHARAVGQVQFACALWHRLPTVAKVFVPGKLIFGWFRRSSAAPKTLMRPCYRSWMTRSPGMPEVDEAVGPEVARSGGFVGGQVRSGGGAGAAEGQ